MILDTVISTSISTTGAFVTDTVYSTPTPSNVDVAPEIEISVPTSAESGVPGGVIGGVGSLASTIVVVTELVPIATASNSAEVAPVILAVYVSPLSARASSVVSTVNVADVSPAGIVTVVLTGTKSPSSVVTCPVTTVTKISDVETMSVETVYVAVFPSQTVSSPLILTVAPASNSFG